MRDQMRILSKSFKYACRITSSVAKTAEYAFHDGLRMTEVSSHIKCISYRRVVVYNHNMSWICQVRPYYIDSYLFHH